MPHEFCSEVNLCKFLHFRHLRFAVQCNQQGLQNAKKRQSLPTFEGNAEKQKLPRQILPARDLTRFLGRDQADIATHSFGEIGK
jgi:hypothetical protein